MKNIFKEVIRRIHKHSVFDIRCKRDNNGWILLKKRGPTGLDGNGAFLEFGKEFDDKPIKQCKRYIACTSFDWEAEKKRLSF